MYVINNKDKKFLSHIPARKMLGWSEQSIPASETRIHLDPEQQARRCVFSTEEEARTFMGSDRFKLLDESGPYTIVKI